MGGGGVCHMGDEKQRRKGKEEICKLYTQAVEVVIRARRGVKGIQLYRRNRNTSTTLISSRFIITLQIKQLQAQNVHFFLSACKMRWLCVIVDTQMRRAQLPSVH